MTANRFTFRQGPADIVLDLEYLVDMLNSDQADFLSGKILARQINEMKKLEREIDELNSQTNEPA